MSSTGAEIDRRLELRVRKLPVFRLTLFLSARLFHGFQVYGYFYLVCCWSFGNGWSDPLCIAVGDFAQNEMFFKSALGSVTQ